MSQPIDLLATYLNLARVNRKKLQPFDADRLLIIAGTIAARMGLPRVSACCRDRVLDHNPNHMLSRWGTVEEALGDGEFLIFLKQQQRKFPQEKAERLLKADGIELARERATYYSDEEYAAALLGETPQTLHERFGL